MSNLFRYLFLGILILELTACMPSKPYEIKSPCVTGENENNAITPCIRRPVNIDIA